MFQTWEKMHSPGISFFFLATLQENNMGHSYQKY